MLLRLILLVFVALIRGEPAYAQGQVTSPKLDAAAALEHSQAALGRRVGDYTLTEPKGQRVMLAQFRGKPLVVSFVYTSCYHTCPTLTNYLAGVVKVAREALGEDSFAVATIGFDVPADTPERMGIFAHERGINLPGWVFLSADAATIEGLARDLGFIYFPSPKGFDHLAQVTVLDAEGRVYRQVYGETFPPPSLVEPLKELVFGNRAQALSLSSWINGIRLFCTVYDPRTGRYTFDYSVFVTLGTGLVSLAAVALFIVRAWRQGKPPATTT